MKVLMIKLSAFGDLIHCLPALDDVLARDDVDEVHWLVDERFAFVTAVFPEQVTIHRVALKGKHPLRAAWQAIRMLRQEKFDWVIDLQSLIKSSLIAAALGSKVVGFDAREIREKPATWLQRSTRFQTDDRHVVQKYRRVAAEPWRQPHAAYPLLAYVEPLIHRDMCEHLDAVLLDGLPDQPWVVLSLGGSWQTKELPDATWRDLITGMQNMGTHAIICWGHAEEQEKAARIAQGTSATVLPERLGMQALCALLLQADVLVATDTGVLHLAAALQRPTVSFWGPSASWRSGPLGERHCFVESNPACGPCFKRQCANFVCMDMIRAEEMIAGLEQVGEGESGG